MTSVFWTGLVGLAVLVISALYPDLEDNQEGRLIMNDHIRKSPPPRIFC